MSLEYLTHKVFIKFLDTATDEIDMWCIEKFGEQGIKWDSYFADDDPWNYDQYYIFENHEDAVLFTLTWV